MVKCAFCDKELMPQYCPMCGKPVCPDHRSPESHSCTGVTDVHEAPASGVGEGVVSGTSGDSEPRDGVKSASMQSRKPGRTAASMALAVCLVISVVGNVVIATQVYLVGYRAGGESGYSMGYVAGQAEGNASGYSIGYTKGVVDGVGRGYTLRDPTYSEVIAFIRVDTTDRNQYVPGSYVCHDFSAAVKTNAFRKGYLCLYVYIELREGAHSIVAFNTTDRGIVFIEPQNDDVVFPSVGLSYWDRSKYDVPQYDDTVVRITLIP